MKLAFSTLACPAWSIEQVAEAAAGLGYDGVELRLLDGEVIDPESGAEKVARAVSLCREQDVEVCALDTSCRFNLPAPAERARQVEELWRWIGLAERTQVPLLRVFGGQGEPGHSDEEANAWVVEALRQAAPDATRRGVTVTLETHDAFASARRVAAVLDAVGSPHVAALWDSHHPYRVGESAAEVVAALDTRIAHVHVKDARRAGPGPEEWQLVLVGEGEVPVREQLQVLRQHGYQGYVSVEWEKKWHLEIAEPEVALPQHIAWLREALSQ